MKVTISCFYNNMIFRSGVVIKVSFERYLFQPGIFADSDNHGLEFSNSNGYLNNCCDNWRV